MTPATGGEIGDGRWMPPRPWLMGLMIGVGMFAVVGAISPAALRVVFRDGPLALAILLAGLGLGSILLAAKYNRGLNHPLWDRRLACRGTGETPVPQITPSAALLSDTRRVSTAERLLYAQGLGLGALSLLVLGLGTLGVLQRGMWIGVVAAFDLIGAIVLIRCIKWGESPSLSPPSPIKDDGAIRWLWMVLVPVGGLALLVATFPPGTLWPAEGNGYDVLEYHLAAPREYFDAGRIGLLPGNIYSNFPFNVEMLYLLAMVLRGDPVKACFAAQLVNAGLAALAVAAIWAAARPRGRLAATAAALLSATCPFVAYLCGLAYVESSLLFFTALALLVIQRVLHRRGTSERQTNDRNQNDLWHRRLAGANTGGTPVPQRIVSKTIGGRSKDSRSWLLGGVFAGLACGCKYIAFPQVFLPLAAAVAWMTRRPAAVGLFVVGGLAAFSPWLIKNVVLTGNPVFPLARSVFHERAGAWDDDGAARWHEGHLPGPEDRSVAARLARFGSEVVVNKLFGATTVAGLAAVLVLLLTRRSLVDLSLHFWLLLGATAVWLGFTHLVGRFAVVLIPSLAILAGAAVGAIGATRRTRAVAVLLVVCVVNMALLVNTFTESGVFAISAARTGDGLAWFVGGGNRGGELWPSHQHVPRLRSLAELGAKVLMVGDARRFYFGPKVDSCVVFDRNPFAEAAEARSSADLLAWLREQGYGFVFLNWSEMNRLRSSRYGFWKSIDDALFERLCGAGLQVRENYSIDEKSSSYATLFQVP